MKLYARSVPPWEIHIHVETQELIISIMKPYFCIHDMNKETPIIELSSKFVANTFIIVCLPLCFFVIESGFNWSLSNEVQMISLEYKIY